MWSPFVIGEPTRDHAPTSSLHKLHMHQSSKATIFQALGNRLISLYLLLLPCSLTLRYLVLFGL